MLLEAGVTCNLGRPDAVAARCRGGPMPWRAWPPGDS